MARPIPAPIKALAQLIRHVNGVDRKPTDLSPQLVRRQRLGPLAFLHGFNEFKNDYLQHGLFADLRQIELSKLYDSLKNRQIQVALLKGISYGETIYGDMAERSMGDVDLLVEPQNFAQARTCLEKQGYRARGNAKEASRFHHAVTFDKGKLTIDLHRHLFQPGRCKIDMSAMWSRASPLTGLHSNIFRFAPEDEFVLHLLHIARSEFMVSAISYVDVPRLEKRAGISRAHLWELASRYRVLRALKSAITLSDAIHQMPLSNPRFLRSRALTPSPGEVLGQAPLNRVRRILVKAKQVDGFQELMGLGSGYIAETVESVWRSRQE